MPIYLENVPLHIRQDMWFQHDGASPHNSKIVTDYLSNVFSKWFGTKGPNEWPLRSPDLTQLDVFFWGYLKEEVYRTQPTSIEDLVNRIVNSCLKITPNIPNNVTNIK